MDEEEEYMGQIKVKSIYASSLEKLDDKINHFVLEEVEDCLVTDVKFNVLLEPESITNKLHYFAMILYV